jgi:O-antigen ligase
MTAVYYSIGGKQMYGSSNQIFYVALLLPFAFLFKNRRFKYYSLLIGLVAVLMSFKRSAIIYTPLVFFVARYFDFLKGKKNSIVKSFFFALVFLSISFFAYDYIDNLTGGHISARFENIEDDKGSGRLDVYKKVIDAYEKKPFEIQLFGAGHNSVIKDKVAWEMGNTVPLSAHNDFIEVLYDFGIIGFFIYLLLIGRIVKLMFRVKRFDTQYFHANLGVLIIFFVMSMVSHLIIYPTYYAYLVIIWAITDGQLAFLTKRINYLMK